MVKMELLFPNLSLTISASLPPPSYIYTHTYICSYTHTYTVNHSNLTRLARTKVWKTSQEQRKRKYIRWPKRTFQLDPDTCDCFSYCYLSNKIHPQVCSSPGRKACLRVVVSESPAGLVIAWSADPQPWVLDSLGLKWFWRMCISTNSQVMLLLMVV